MRLLEGFKKIAGRLVNESNEQLRTKKIFSPISRHFRPYKKIFLVDSFAHLLGSFGRKNIKTG